MRAQLQDMAGPGAVIRVDSFEGAQLPPKAQIKSIHITRDQFAAENHSAGGSSSTSSRSRASARCAAASDFSLRDGSLSGRSPFTPTKGPEQTQNYGFEHRRHR